MSTPNESTPAPSEAVESQDSSDQAIESSNAEEGSAEGEEAPVVPVEAKKEIAKTLRKLKLKFNKQEIEEELPFEIPDTEEAREYMTRQLQLSKLSQTSAQEKAQMERELADFIEQIRKDPRSVLSDPSLGLDLKKFAADIIEEEIENSRKSPEQLEKEKLEKELKALKEQYENEKKDFQTKEFERLQSAALEQYDIQIDTAIKGSNLPKSPYVVKKIADYMLMGLQQGIDVSAKDVLPLVEEEIQADIRSMLDAAPDEVVQKILGKDKLNSIRKKNLAKAKAMPPKPISKSIPDVGGKSSAKKDAPKQTFKDFFKF